MSSLKTQHKKLTLRDYVLIGFLVSFSVFLCIVAAFLCISVYKRSLWVDDLAVRYKHTTYSAKDAEKKLIGVLNSLPISERKEITTKLDQAARKISDKIEAVWFSGKPVVCEIDSLPIKGTPILRKVKVQRLLFKKQRVEISYGDSFYDIVPLSKCYALFPSKTKDSTFYARSIVIKYPLNDLDLPTSETSPLNKNSVTNFLFYLANAYYYDNKFALYRKHYEKICHLSEECRKIIKEADRLVTDTPKPLLFLKVPILKKAIQCKHDYLNDYYTFEAKALIDFLKSASVDDIKRAVVVEKIFIVKPADKKGTILIPIKNFK